jgi:thiamine monophosphate kinase
VSAAPGPGLGEFELIRRYFERPVRRAALGVGDDCALLALTAAVADADGEGETDDAAVAERDAARLREAAARAEEVDQ